MLAFLSSFLASPPSTDPSRASKASPLWLRVIEYLLAQKNMLYMGLNVYNSIVKGLSETEWRTDNVTMIKQMPRHLDSTQSHSQLLNVTFNYSSR